MYSPTEIRLEFPILSQHVHGHSLIYLDNGATTQKPRCVMESMQEACEIYNANIHRGVHYLSQRATDAYEEARTRVAHYLNAPDRRSVIFTSGTTGAINLGANCLAESLLQEGDAILVSEMEHHSNLVSWQLVAKRYKLRLLKWPILDSGALDMAALPSLLAQGVKVVAITHVSNVMGLVNPIAEIAPIVHAAGALLFVDGAQGVKHFPIDVQALGADFYAFSGHKIYGPTGIGVLWGRYELMDRLTPWQGGGEMVGHVSFKGTTYADLPFRLEAGTPAYVEAIGLGNALVFYGVLSEETERGILPYESQLMEQTYTGLRTLGAEVYGYTPSNAAIVSFNFPGIHAYDVGTLLDQIGIAVRTGTHCAEPLMSRLGVTGTIRASFALYNTEEEVVHFLSALKKAKEMLS